MTYYIFIENEKINGTGQCKVLNQDILNIEVEEEIYNNIEKYMYQDGEIVLDPDYEAREAQKVQKELVEYNYEAKAKKAYGGILINDTYLFETNETSQSMITASLIGLQSASDETTLNWKVYTNNQPTVVPLTKVQLSQLFAFALNMINTSFGLEGVRNNDLAIATVEELNDETWVEQYKIATDLAFNQINNKIDVVLVKPPVEEETDTIEPTEEPVEEESNIENLEEV